MFDLLKGQNKGCFTFIFIHDLLAFCEETGHAVAFLPLGRFVKDPEDLFKSFDVLLCFLKMGFQSRLQFVILQILMTLGSALV